MTRGDLNRVIRLESFLRNEPDLRQEIVVADLKGKTDAELKAMVRQELAMLKELEAQGTEIRSWEKEGRLLEEKEPTEGNPIETQ